MQKKKILYIITKSNLGGAQRYVYDLVTHIPKDKFKPVVAFGDSGILKEKLEEAGIQTVTILGLERDIGFIKEVRAFLNILKIIREVQPDIIHLNSSKAAALGAFAASFCNLIFSVLHSLRVTRYTLHAKIVFTVHGWPFREPRQFPIRMLIWFVSYLTAFSAHHTIALSTGDLLLGQRMPGVAKKISLIYNGINEIQKVFSRTEARQKLKISSNVFLIGDIAELNRNKDIGTLIQAMALLPKETLLCIVGNGEERENLQTLAKVCGVGDRVIFAGQIDNASTYLSAFDIFAIPSLKEGLPYSILEAGIQEIPVVGTDISGIRDIITGKQNGMLVPPRNPQALAEALGFLIAHPEKAKEFGEQLQKTVAEKFTLEKMISETIALYRN